MPSSPLWKAAAATSWNWRVSQCPSLPPVSVCPIVKEKCKTIMLWFTLFLFLNCHPLSMPFPNLEGDQCKIRQMVIVRCTHKFCCIYTIVWFARWYTFVSYSRVEETGATRKLPYHPKRQSKARKKLEEGANICMVKLQAEDCVTLSVPAYSPVPPPTPCLVFTPYSQLSEHVLPHVSRLIGEAMCSWQSHTYTYTQVHTSHLIHNAFQSYKRNKSCYPQVCTLIHSRNSSFLFQTHL